MTSHRYVRQPQSLSLRQKKLLAGKALFTN